MKIIFACLIFLSAAASAEELSLLELSEKGNAAREVDITEGPFYMMNFFEITEIDESQRSFYLEKVPQKLSSMKTSSLNPVVDKVSEKDLRNAALDQQTWEDLMKKTWRLCAEPMNRKLCDELEQDRLDTLERRGRQRLEDRQAKAAEKKNQAVR
jgi:hypothetical protein